MPRFTKRVHKKTNRKHKKRMTIRKKNRHIKKYRLKYGGAGAISGVAKLPMLIDQNQVTYTCTPTPTS